VQCVCVCVHGGVCVKMCVLYVHMCVLCCMYVCGVHGGVCVPYVCGEVCVCGCDRLRHEDHWGLLTGIVAPGLRKEPVSRK